MNEVSMYFRQSSKKEEVKQKPPAIEKVEKESIISEVDSKIFESKESVMSEKGSDIQESIETSVKSEVKGKVSDSTTVDSTTVDSTTVDSTTVDSTTVDEKPVDESKWTAWNTSSNYDNKDTVVYKRVDTSKSHGSWSKRNYGDRGGYNTDNHGRNNRSNSNNRRNNGNNRRNNSSNNNRRNNSRDGNNNRRNNSRGGNNYNNTRNNSRDRNNYNNRRNNSRDGDNNRRNNNDDNRNKWKPIKTPPIKTQVKTPIKTQVKTSPIKLQVKTSPIKTQVKTSPIKTSPIKTQVKIQVKTSPIKTLVKPTKGWKPKRIDTSTIEGKREMCLKNAKGCLNKMTGYTFDKLSGKYLDIAMTKNEGQPVPGLLKLLIDQIFEQALLQPAFCELYSNLCFKMNEATPIFRRELLGKCQEEFDYDDIQKMEFDFKAKIRTLGNIKFIGELYKKKILVIPIIHACIKRLLKQTPEEPDEEQLESLCKLLINLGSMIDVGRTKAIMDRYFKHMKEIQEGGNISSRLRFMMEDIFELRNNKWKSLR